MCTKNPPLEGFLCGIIFLLLLRGKRTVFSMQHSMFTGNSQNADVDTVAKKMKTVSQYALVVVFGLLPILFIPSLSAPFLYSKVLFVVAAVAVALVLFSFAVLRNGSLRMEAPYGLLALWGVAGVTVLSSLLSGDFTDSFIGDSFSVHTALFVVLMALVASSVSLLKSAKNMIIKLYSLLAVSALVLALFHLLRVLLGPEALSFGLFTGETASLMGSWNDVGLFFGLVILLALVAVEQLPLTKWGQWALMATTVASLLILAVINFSAVWWVLGLVSLVVLMYSLVKPRFAEAPMMVGEKSDSFMSTVLSGIVFAAATLFIVGGSFFGGIVSDVTGVSYIEVRPSFEATVDVARSVYTENAFVGVGPNKFADAWRLYKDSSINQTLFWNTNFPAGNGYIPTTFVTSGIFGVIAWLLFIGLMVWSGVRMLMRAGSGDRFWLFIGTSSFVAALYLWGMAFIYVPSTVVLLLAAVFTGVLFAAYSVMVPQRSVSISMQDNRQVGFVLVVVSMVIIVGSVSSLYFIGRHYAALYSFAAAQNSIAPGTTVEAVTGAVNYAYQLSANDRFAREIAEYQYAQVSALLRGVNDLSTLNEVQQQQLRDALSIGIQTAQVAVSQDETESDNWLTLARMYGAFIILGEAAAVEPALEAVNQAERYDPKSPVYPFLRAEIELARGDVEAARSAAEESLSRKSDYIEAAELLLQIDIAEGSLEQAIARTAAIISFEPQNAVRYFQLGQLYVAAQNIEAAEASFRQAVRLDTNYANARYVLALVLADKGDSEGALEQLLVVQELNPDNEGVASLISQLESGEVPAVTAEEESADIEEPAAVNEAEDGTVTVEQEPDTSLVTPVNVVPETDEEPEVPAEEGETSDDQ